MLSMKYRERLILTNRVYKQPQTNRLLMRDIQKLI